VRSVGALPLALTLVGRYLHVQGYRGQPRRLHATMGQTILREILLVADHNAYHIGEFAILRQVMQTWPMG
jgi:hypothetical protein